MTCRVIKLYLSLITINAAKLAVLRSPLRELCCPLPNAAAVMLPWRCKELYRSAVAADLFTMDFIRYVYAQSRPCGGRGGDGGKRRRQEQSGQHDHHGDHVLRAAKIYLLPNQRALIRLDW